MAHASSRADGDILVIDDDAILRDLVADWLEAKGYRVRKAANCQAALKALEEAPAALVVSDMFMPGPCGAAAIAELGAARRRPP
jgi:DNA-binding NtrC family response regulator